VSGSRTGMGWRRHPLASGFAVPAFPLVCQVQPNEHRETRLPTASGFAPHRFQWFAKDFPKAYFLAGIPLSSVIVGLCLDVYTPGLPRGCGRNGSIPCGGQAWGEPSPSPPTAATPLPLGAVSRRLTERASLCLPAVDKILILS
jgi:hypothetical protein